MEVNPWSDAEIEAVFGHVPAEQRRDVDVGLRDVDRLLRGVANQLDCGFRYSTEGPRGVWTGLGAALDAPRIINNEDGTVSRGSLGANVTIELPPASDRWFVWATVGQNCNRRRCPDDPHELLYEEGEATTPAEAVSLILAFTLDVLDTLSAMAPEQRNYFVHG